MEHFLGSIGFEYNLCGLNRVSLRDVHQEVNMVEGKAEITKLESKAFQVMERLDADVNVDLFSKTVVSIVGNKHHRHPVIASITHNLFRATANHNFHIIDFSCRTFIGHTLAGVPRATKRGDWSIG